MVGLDFNRPGQVELVSLANHIYFLGRLSPLTVNQYLCTFFLLETVNYPS